MSAKYPRTSHLPYSPGGTDDDRRIKTVSHFLGRPIVITEKMDGSNLCMTSKDIFARSHSGPPTHPSFDRAKARWSEIRHLIDDHLNLFNEWCYARHSIPYTALPDFMLLFGVREHRDTWWSWDEVEFMAQVLGVPTVPVLWKGSVATAAELEKIVTHIAGQISACGGDREGVVVRVADRIIQKDWERSIAKWVRADHVQTDDHWTHGVVVPNILKSCQS